MTKQEIYDTIVSLTEEIKTTDVGAKLFEAAKSENPRQKINEVVNAFVRKKPILYQKLFIFANKFNTLAEESETGNECEIFGLRCEEKYGFFVLDPDIIHAPSFFAFTFLSGIHHSYLFTCSYIEVGDEKFITSDSAYLDAIEKESGSSDLANYLAVADFSDIELEEIANYYEIKVSDTYDLLAKVFAGKLKEYVEYVI